MRISGIDFPKPLLDAVRDSRLVVFAGAGVSMGEPANLPSFEDLAKAIAQGTGETMSNNEGEDRFLGKLHYKGVDVHSKAAQELSRHGSEPTALHGDLLRLYSAPGNVRIVTTNLDTLFERSAVSVFETQPQRFDAPALPLGSDFKGIVHIHGSLENPNDMVITDSDFGKAYLTQGWARRFLVDLFDSFTVLFVGYSHNDMVMNYLARALPVSEKDRFVLTAEAADGKWQLLNVLPVTYTNLTGDDHSALREGISGLASYARRGILDWQREITSIAQSPPSLDEEAMDLIYESLSDPTRTRLFTSAASNPKWIDWLDRHGCLNGLFASGAGEISERDSELAEWLAQSFARVHAEDLFHLIIRHNLRVHPVFWFALGRAVGLAQDEPMEPEDLSRWVSLLLATAPYRHAKDLVLPWLGERCDSAGLNGSLLEIFTEMTSSQLVLSSLTPFEEGADSGILSSIFPTAGPMYDHFDLNEFWSFRLKPRLDQITGPLLSIVVHNLATQHKMLSAWQNANENWSPTSSDRSAIEPHEQDSYPEASDVLIDAARDCLEHLGSTQPLIAADWCNRLAKEAEPTLRRLAVHTLSVRKDLDAN